MTKKIEIGVIYEHYKGHRYKVIGLAKHSETQEELIVYQDLNDENSLWVRPKDMFLENVNIDGKKIERFKKIE
jgi:hypothetical protein